MELRGKNKVELIILFRFWLTASQKQDTSNELKAPEVSESFSHSHLIFQKHLDYFKLSQAEEDNHPINKVP